jgi:hypothetical protein
MSKKPNSNISRAKKLALHIVKGNADLNILPAYKCNERVVLNTVDYMKKVMALLDDEHVRH